MENKLRVFFAGDFCSKPSTSKIEVSDELISLIKMCDVSVVNFEVPLKPEIKMPSQNRERFFQNDDVPAFLRGLGFNLFQLANNHAFDWGEEGYKKTKAALGKDTFGIGDYDEAYKVKVIQRNGIIIGFLALSYAAYTGVFDDVMNHDGLGCAYINDLKVNHIIIDAKKHVDFLFVLPHDGIEYIDIPTPEIIARYRDFINYGADGVIGTHPHCPQGWEEYKGKMIFYSLGNFFFNSKNTTEYRADKPHWYEGLCLVLNITNGKLSWETVNTKNVNNVALEIDHSEARIKHNETICRYLTDKKLYDEYLKSVCLDFEVKKKHIIDTTFHPQNLKLCTKLLLHYWIKKIRKQKFGDDFYIERLLAEDTIRNVFIRSIKK